jgi:hypothetical protein
MVLNFPDRKVKKGNDEIKQTVHKHNLTKFEILYEHV